MINQFLKSGDLGSGFDEDSTGIQTLGGTYVMKIYKEDLGSSWTLLRSGQEVVLSALHLTVERYQTRL